MDSLLAGAARLPEPEAKELAARLYGIPGEVSRLPAEQGDNFRLGTGYVLRVAHPAQGDGVLRFQVRALQHLAQTDPGLPVPRVIPSLSGDAVTLLPGGRQAVLTTFLDGQLLNSVAISAPGHAPLRRELGATLARLNLALRSFSDPAASHVLLWDIRQAYRLRDLASEIRGGAELLEWLDHFDEVVRPALTPLRTQVLHNDFSRDNVLVDETRVTGILDFGDMVHTHVAADVAVAACYQLGDDHADPAEPALDLIAGYHAADPLTASELSLLYDLIVTRLAARVIIPLWRAARFPGNAEYVLRNAERSRALFQRVLGLDPDAVTARVLAACES
jgi:hydroxylysine kinase